MNGAPAKPQPPVRTDDTKAIVRSIVGTGIGVGTLLLMLIGLMFQQNANVNARIDDVNANMNARFNDVNAHIDDMQADIRELRAEVRSDIRELREIVINVLKGNDRSRRLTVRSSPFSRPLPWWSSHHRLPAHVLIPSPAA